MRDFQGRVAVVTGAASGIGLAMARRFAAAGMKVVLADVEEASLAAAETGLRAEGATTLALRTDVASGPEVEALARRTLDAFGAVHVLCNNAGVAAGGLLWEMREADWTWVLGVNLWGVIHGCRVFLPSMLAQGGEAHVVNTASMAGLISTPFNAIYAVTKHAVVGLSESLHLDLLAVGARVRVSVLCPGWVDTRIADSDRNRPAALGATQRPETPEAQAMEQAVRQFLANGLSPAEVAERVFEAVRDERFYVLTHPAWKPAIRARMETILEERTPAFGAVP